MGQDTYKFIDDTIKNNKVVLFMKGAADFPQCGFSAAVVHVLNTLGVEFKDINVLTSDELRQGIKDYADWPTIPQLYINGEFVGGCDIVKELYSSGELKKMLESR
ncbi:MAG: Glutaredoxin [Pseudomonadota bacterium]|jgi:monothiol glutaredoxin